MRFLMFFFSALVLLAQNPNTARFPAALATDSDLLVAYYGPVMISGSVSSTATAFSVYAPRPVYAPVMLLAGSELIRCSLASNNDLSDCVRGLNGTLPASHSGAVQVIVDFNQAAAEVKAIEVALGINLGNIGGVGLGDMLAATYVTTGAGAPVGSCAKDGATYRNGSASPNTYYFCAGTTWVGPFATTANIAALSAVYLGLHAKADTAGNADTVTGGVYTSGAGTVYLTPAGSGAGLTGITATQVGLGGVTNDAQTKAAIVPNTAPAAGRVLVGNAGGTAYAPVPVSGDATLASTGALTVTTLGGVAVAQAATASTILQRNASGEVIAANTVPTGKTPMATDTPVTPAQLANASLGTGASSFSRTATAGVGGVTAKYLAAKDTTDPTRRVLPSSGGCGGGIAATTATVGNAFELFVVPGTVITGVADNAVTAGHILVGGTTTPGRVLDSGQTSRKSISSGTCVVGVALQGATTGSDVLLEYDGPGSFGAGIQAADLPAVNLPTPAATCTMSGNSTVCVCTTTCTVTPLAPVAGSQFCARNDTGVSTVITVAAIASVFYEKTDSSAYGTVNTVATSAGAVGDKICIVGRDATHYQTWSSAGTWAVN